MLKYNYLLIIMISYGIPFILHFDILILHNIDCLGIFYILKSLY